jgi:hypothetical protein
MFDCEVFDASILQHLHLNTWSESDVFAEFLSTSTGTITSDGHFVLWSKLVSPALRTEGFSSIAAACSGEDIHLISPFGLKLFYRDTLHWGQFLHLERFTYSGYRVPEVFGNDTDQQPGYTALTIVSKRQTLDLLRDKWKSCVSLAGHVGKSAFYVAASGAAIQARFCCEEVRIEDVIDFYVAAAFAIKEQRKSRMLLGLSYTNMVESPPVKEPCEGKLIPGPSYPSPRLMEVRVNIEDKYGPFEKI